MMVSLAAQANNKTWGADLEAAVTSLLRKAALPALLSEQIRSDACSLLGLQFAGKTPRLTGYTFLSSHSGKWNLG